VYLAYAGCATSLKLCVPRLWSILPSRLKVVIPVVDVLQGTKAGIQEKNIKATGCRIEPGMTKLLDSPVKPGNDKKKEVTFIA